VANKIPDMRNPTMICIGPTSASNFYVSAEARRALVSVPGVLAGCNSDDQELHTHTSPILSLRR
jgi:hypothetical protein